MGGFGGFASFAPIGGGAPAATTSTLNAGGSVFIPKKKQAELGLSGAFPALGTTTSAPAEKKKDENADPCQGKPKEFFIYEYDARSNVCICKAEQRTFVAIHFPDHYDSPIDILMWLYDMAEYRDEIKRQPKITPNTKQTKKKEIEEYDEIDDEETNFGPKSYKDIKKQAKKPAAPPSKPQMKDGKTMTEAQKEQERQKKLKAMEDNKKKEEEKKMRKDVGKDKDL